MRLTCSRKLIKKDTKKKITFDCIPIDPFVLNGVKKALAPLPVFITPNNNANDGCKRHKNIRPNIKL